MSHRKKRLEKLIQHRVREVENRLQKLAEARMAEERARQVLMAEEQALERARQERAEATSRLFDVKSLTLTNDWLVSCARRRDLAEREVLNARRGLTEAQKQLIVAKGEQKKIELIAERIATEERVRAERIEQRMTDEFAAQRVEAEKRRGEP